MKADTGATSTYIRQQDAGCAINSKTITHGPTIMQPDKSTLKVKQSCEISFTTQLSEDAKAAYIVPALKNSSLLSIGKLCDDNCIALFTKRKLFIIKNNNLLLQGQRNDNDGLWDVMFPRLSNNSIANEDKTKKHSLNYIIQSDKSKFELAQYLHACCFSPCLSTFTKAIQNGNFLSWPAIHTINFKKVLGNTIPMAKGHLEQGRANLQSTKINEETEKDYFPKQEEKIGECIFKLIDIEELNGKSYMDLCGKFPHTSSRGAKYLLILYDHDSNIIEGTTLKSRSAKEITDKWRELYHKITKNTITTKFWIIDNEASAYLKDALKTEKQDHQLTPPHMHRINAAERAIRTYKNHLLAGLATCDAEFPITEWDRIITRNVT